MSAFNTYLLIDHENVHPSILELKGIREDVILFIFARGNERFPLAFYNYVSKRGRFVEIKGTGRNLLDFHIILYIGKFITESKYKHLLDKSEDIDSVRSIATTTEIKNINIDTQDKIYILSRDTDYDGVLKFLYENENFYIKRVNSLEELPEDLYFSQKKLKLSVSIDKDLNSTLQESEKISADDISEIVNKIQSLTKKPKKLDNLVNLINTHFNDALTYNSILYILKALIVERQLLMISENERIVWLIE